MCSHIFIDSWFFWGFKSCFKTTMTPKTPALRNFNVKSSSWECAHIKGIDNANKSWTSTNFAASFINLIFITNSVFCLALALSLSLSLCFLLLNFLCLLFYICYMQLSRFIIYELERNLINENWSSLRAYIQDQRINERILKFTWLKLNETNIWRDQRSERGGLKKKKWSKKNKLHYAVCLLLWRCVYLFIYLYLFDSPNGRCWSHPTIKRKMQAINW